MAEQQVTRFFRISNFPIMFGRLPNSGEKIWGGPYTLAQVVTACIAFLVLYNTVPLWGFGSIFLDIPVGAALVYGAVYAAGLLRRIEGNALLMAGGLARSSITSGQGTYRGTAVMLPRPGVRHGQRVLVDCREAAPFAEPAVEAVPTPAPVSTTVDRPHTSPPVSAVQRLLADASASH